MMEEAAEAAMEAVKYTDMETANLVSLCHGRASRIIV
jgi:hypothetical protein